MTKEQIRVIQILASSAYGTCSKNKLEFLWMNSYGNLENALRILVEQSWIKHYSYNEETYELNLEKLEEVLARFT